MSDVSTSADAGSAAVDSVAEPAAASQFAGAPILEVKDLAVSFGGIKAVNGLTFSVHEGEIVSVIGPNGAGKTSAFNCISGFYRPNQGSVVFDPGQTSQTVSVSVFGDTTYEPDETFLLNLSNTIGAGLGDPQGVPLGRRPAGEGAVRAPRPGVMPTLARRAGCGRRGPGER